MLKKILCFVYGHQLLDYKRKTVYITRTTDKGFINHHKRKEQSYCKRCQKYKDIKC